MRSRVFVAFAALVAASIASAGCSGCKKGASGADGGVTSTGGVFDFLTGGSFEGEITMRASSRSMKTPTNLTFDLKSPKLRVDAPGSIAPGNAMLAQGASLVMDTPKKEGFLLIPARKQAVILDLDELRAMKTPPSNPGLKAGPDLGKAPEEPPTVDKTGQKDSVAGYACEIWKLTEKTGRHADLCVADGITWIDLTALGSTSPELAAAAFVGDANHFPLRAVAYDEKNVEEGRLEAIKIDKQKLDDARFALPSDYQTIEIGQALQGLGAGGGAGHGPQPGLKRLGH
jgi:hypothetical protein